MGNNRFNEEEVLRYLGDGWHFRVKTVKGRRYITRRRGQEERGMGPFDADVWALISQLEKRAKPEEIVRVRAPEISWPVSKTEPELGEVPDQVHRGEYYEDKWRELEKEISLARSAIMMTSCVHRDNEYYCTYWNWERKPRFFTMLDELCGEDSYKKKIMITEGKMVERWVVKSFLWYCSTCSAYCPR